MTLPRPRHRRRRSARSRAIKDRLIQTRVPESLESALKEEARKRRLSVSHLIRNMLEDTFHLVDNVVAEVDNLVHDSVGLARQVRKDAVRIAGHVRVRSTPPEDEAPYASKKVSSRVATNEVAKKPAKSSVKAKRVTTAEVEAKEGALDHVLAWNQVVMNRDGICAKCGKALSKGDHAHLGLSSVPGAAPTWLCTSCL